MRWDVLKISGNAIALGKLFQCLLSNAICETAKQLIREITGIFFLSIAAYEILSIMNLT